MPGPVSNAVPHTAAFDASPCTKGNQLDSKCTARCAEGYDHDGNYSNVDTAPYRCQLNGRWLAEQYNLECNPVPCGWPEMLQSYDGPLRFCFLVSAPAPADLFPHPLSQAVGRGRYLRELPGPGGASLRRPMQRHVRRGLQRCGGLLAVRWQLATDEPLAAMLGRV